MSIQAEKSDAIVRQIDSLKSEARGEKLQSWFLLVLMVIVLAVGVNSFDEAGRLAREEVSSIERLSSRADELVERVETSIGLVDKSRTEISEHLKNPNSTPPTSSQVELFYKNNEASTRALEAIRDELKGAFKTEMEKAVSNMTQASESGAKTAIIVQTSVTRAGIVALIIFLVQVILRLYRRSSRICRELNSRADALSLSFGSFPFRSAPDALKFLSVGENDDKSLDHDASLKDLLDVVRSLRVESAKPEKLP